MTGAWPLTGRDEELDVIANIVHGTGNPSGVVIAGSPGVGKTRLARESLLQAESLGRHARWIVATRSAKTLPLGAFVEIASEFGPDPLRRVGEVIEALVADTAGPGAVIGIDDAHLLDDLSALVVHQLVTRRRPTVIATVRSGEPAPDAVTALWKEHHLERLELQPLSLDETTRLLESVLGGQLDTRSARRLWTLTRGNALYLRQLLDDEVAAARIKQFAGVWVWDGEPVISAGLRELVGARMGRLSGQVGEVLDMLAVCEPLDAVILGRLSDPLAVEEAETRGLIAVGADRRRQVRLAHPLFGELRRTTGGNLRQSRIRGLVANELATCGDPDMRDTVRRAVLTLDSDLDPDFELLSEAAQCAMQLLDLTLAERLSRAAITAGGGSGAELAHAVTLTTLGRGVEAEFSLAQLASQDLSDTDAAHVGTVRAAITAWMLASPARAQQILDATHESATRSGLVGSHLAVGASLQAALGHPDDAVTTATTALSAYEVPDFESTFATIALVIGWGDTGRVVDMMDEATRAYDRATQSIEASQLRFVVGLYQSVALRLAGYLDTLASWSERLHHDSTNVPGVLQGMTAMLKGHAELCFGHLGLAIRWFNDARAEFALLDEVTSLRIFCLIWLTEALAKAGRHHLAREALHDLDAMRPPDFVLADTGCSTARAWVHAAEGAIGEAISIARVAADTAAARGQPAHEVLCLQAATQFGDTTTGARLYQLSHQLETPRASAVAAHAQALAAGDGRALEAASQGYESMGDRLAAADAAAQAAIAFANTDRRGAALTARATADRLTHLCAGADTPALRQAAEPFPLTGRQREIVQLATRGLSNREIAERLVVSVRTVEGHLYRASLRAGVTSRDDLIAMLRGK